jgi:hypothetical protein
MFLLKVVNPMNIYQHIKFHGPTLTDPSFSTNLRSFNVRHFGADEATGLKI